MLIPSANDAANVLAEHVAGSISAFAELMNEKAIEIGCTGSNFTNPSGIHDENLYTTAYDLALIARYAMDFETFRTIVATTSYTLPSTSIYTATDRTFYTSNYLLKTTEKTYYYEYATGIKTGYTTAAGGCLVASAKKDDVEFIAVVLGAGYTENGLIEKFLDCKTLFNFAFDNYTTYYQNLQLEKELSLNNLVEELSIDSDTTDYAFLRGLSKIIAVVAIFMALIFIFGRRKRRKKKNRYKFGGKRRGKHRR